jgi:DNA segregation ATPase FtsK/SpoIIIE-like protein
MTHDEYHKGCGCTFCEYSPERAAELLAKDLAEDARRRVDEGKDGRAPMKDDYDDPYYPQARAIIRDNDTVRISRLQSTLRIGYNRAVHLMERAVKEGLAVRVDAPTYVMYRRADNGAGGP